MSKQNENLILWSAKYILYNYADVTHLRKAQLKNTVDADDCWVHFWLVFWITLTLAVLKPTDFLQQRVHFTQEALVNPRTVYRAQIIEGDLQPSKENISDSSDKLQLLIVFVLINNTNRL